MGFSVKSGPSIPGQLKVAYAKIIKPFEEYRIKVLANTAPTSAIATPPPAMRSLAKTSVSEEPATPELAGSHADPATPLAAMQGAKDASEALNTALQAATMPKTEPEKRMYCLTVAKQLRLIPFVDQPKQLQRQRWVRPRL